MHHILVLEIALAPREEYCGVDDHRRDDIHKHARHHDDKALPCWLRAQLVGFGCECALLLLDVLNLLLDGCNLLAHNILCICVTASDALLQLSFKLLQLLLRLLLGVEQLLAAVVDRYIATKGQPANAKLHLANLALVEREHGVEEEVELIYADAEHAGSQKVT